MKKIKDLKDGSRFYLSKRKKVIYRLEAFEKNTAVITSENSQRTFWVLKNTECYPV